MSYCDCDYEPVDFCQVYEIKSSRKQHKCSECHTSSAILLNLISATTNVPLLE